MWFIVIIRFKTILYFTFFKHNLVPYESTNTSAKKAFRNILQSGRTIINFLFHRKNEFLQTKANLTKTLYRIFLEDPMEQQDFQNDSKRVIEREYIF